MVSTVCNVLYQSKHPQTSPSGHRSHCFHRYRLTGLHLVEGLLEVLDEVWDMDCLKALMVLGTIPWLRRRNMGQRARCGGGRPSPKLTGMEA